MKLVSIALISLFFTVSIFASGDDTKVTIQKVNSLIKKEQFDDAKMLLTDAIAKSPDDMVLQEKMGRLCFSMDNGEREAIQYLAKVANYNSTKNVVSKSSLEVLYFLSQSYHLNGQYDEALETMLLAKAQVPAEEKTLLAKIDVEIQQLQEGIELKKNPLQFKSTNLGSVVNSRYEDHSPVISSDESRLIFTSTRPISKDKTVTDPVETIWESFWNGKDWSQPKALYEGINGQGNNATCSLSFDGKTLFFFRNVNGEGDIYTSQLNGANEWSTPVKMPRPINSSSDETSAAMSADGSMLFFTSNRPGGFGGLDIYVVRKLPNGEWGKEQNLGPKINTSDDEESPFFHADGETLYFSSRGHLGLNSGAFDIFKATLGEDGVWSAAENVGYPINTPDDDLFYQPTIDGQRVYYVSHKNTGEGASDLYLLEFLDSDKRAMSVVTCTANPLGNDSTINATLVVKDLETHNTVGSYKCNPSNGKFVVIIPVGKSYSFDFDYPGCTTVSREVSVAKRTEYVATRKSIVLETIDFIPKVNK